jgi:hypothetical protein
MDQAACLSAYYTSLLAWVGCAVYADAGEDGRIDRLDLVCTGYRPEADGNG